MIYTIGYTGITLPLLQQFVQVRQALVVDIRYRPTSHNPTWRREALQRTLGARYVHVQALGNRNYKGGPIAIVDIEEGTAQVRALLTQVPAAVLLCVCADVHRCHRKGVAEAIGQTLGCPVEHVQLDTPPSPQLPLW